VLPLIFHEAYTNELFHYICDFITNAGLQVDGLGVVLSLDEVIGDVVLDILMMLILWILLRTIARTEISLRYFLKVILFLKK
jgi:hypothetical protein